MKAVFMLVCFTALAGSVLALDPLPQFPNAPAPLRGYLDGVVAPPRQVVVPELAALSLVEAAAHTEETMADPSLPSSTVALAAAFPSATHNLDPAAVALALEVPSPATFLKDDAFVQEMERAQAQAGSLMEADSVAAPQPQDVKASLDSLNSLYNSGYGPMPVRAPEVMHPQQTQLAQPGAPLFPSHRAPSKQTQFPLHDHAPHQPLVSRRYRTAHGIVQRNVAFKEGVKDSQFPHHGGFNLKPADEKEAAASKSLLQQSSSPVTALKDEIKQGLRRHVGKFVSLAELGGRAKPTGNVKPNPVEVQPTVFQGSFPYVQAARARMRSQAERLKSAQAAAEKAKADVARLTAVLKKRQAVIEQHVNIAHKAHNNLHTMFGSTSGSFRRIRSHTAGHRGSGGSVVNPAHRRVARRIVPQRLQRLEDERMAARRRSLKRGRIGATYRAQAHGKKLGVAHGATSFIEMGGAAAAALHNAPPPMRDLPPL